MNCEHILHDISQGKVMSDEEFIHLFQNAELISLAQAADEMRTRRFPSGLVTFVIDRNINYTNICTCQCKFCAFYRNKEDADAYVIDEKLLYQKIDEALAQGATQLMIQGGLNPDLSIEYYERMFVGIKEKYAVTIHSLTAPEVVFIAKNSGLSVEDALIRLRKSGLDSLPGGGAEILHDDIRKKISPNKINTEQWLSVMRSAHKIGMKTTATMMMGAGENIEHRLAHLRHIRDLQEETQGFRAFICWTYQPGNSMLEIDKISTSVYLRFLALARLYLHNIEHIQGSFVTQGTGVGQLSLYFGCDDLGSIMLEENVVRATGTVNNMYVEKMKKIIREAGKTPALRDTEYKVLQVFP
ncbi:MAG: dehypoxanthine futalosine cyclase [Syntrophomonadaceae bacterium]|jgi:cyclic dehypoxanthinyl futalosine synthase|nr:dehypoxanthine futalosine cyclase [Syntrophomonadaceae bacterium]